MRLRNEEQYLFYRLYSNDLVLALSTIRILKRYRRNDVLCALLRDIVVSYVRPFSTNQGKRGKHILRTKNIVPATMLSLHEELVNLRMRQFAHTDMIEHDPKTVLWAGGAYYMSFKAVDYDTLLSKINDIERLVRAVAVSVSACISEYEDTGLHWNHEDAIRIMLPTLDGKSFL